MGSEPSHLVPFLCKFRECGGVRGIPWSAFLPVSKLFSLDSVKGPALIFKPLCSDGFLPVCRARATPNRRQGDSDPPIMRLRSPDGACAGAALVDNLGVNETTNPPGGEFGPPFGAARRRLPGQGERGGEM